jgi:acetyltransferase-like isoleucine patch superfamily enzyme
MRARGRLTLGRGVRIGEGARIRIAPGAHVTIEDGARIGDRLRIEAFAGHVRIGAEASLADAVRITAHADVTVGDQAVLGDYTAILTSLPAHADPAAPAARRAPRTAPVTIEHGARLQPGAVVEPGATVPKDSTVPARSIVTQTPAPASSS